MFTIFSGVFLFLNSASANAVETSAPAAGSGTAPGNDPKVMLIMFGIFAVFFYVSILRPQKQQQKTRDAMLKSLNVGDKILTVGGIFGEITEVLEKSIRVKIAKDVIVRMARSGVQTKTSSSQEE